MRNGASTATVIWTLCLFLGTASLWITTAAKCLTADQAVNARRLRTTFVERQPRVGLGIKLRPQNGWIQVTKIDEHARIMGDPIEVRAQCGLVVRLACDPCDDNQACLGLPGG